ncbi:MAG: DUF885 domain-containing protein [Ilumatobacteraceae bacterium]
MTELTPIFALADRFVSESAALDPYSATGRGIPGYDDLVTDYSPDGAAARADHVRATLHELGNLAPANDDDRLAKDYLGERLHVMVDAYDTGEWMRALRAIAAPASTIRSVFDLMSRDGDEAWTHIASRLESVPDALAGLRASLEAGRASDIVASQRQTEVVAAQCATWADDRWFDSLAAEATARDDLDAELVARLAAGATTAIEAFGAFAGYLRHDYLPDATPVDACGPERYSVGIRAMLGAELDPAEMYEWAWHEYASLRHEIHRTCEIIQPGASFAQVRELLDTDPDRVVHGEDAYREWLQAMTDEALRRAAEHFEIPAAMNRCEARIPPAGSAAAAYYTGPSEDFTRPGRTWYPTLGRTSFPKWGDVTTCYHESVPGHHLQIAYAKLQADHLSRFQRGSFVSGHGEGWALYAERLCDELGWFEDPDHRLGFLCGQQLRAVRVIVDIGMHLGMTIPHGTTLSDGSAFHGGELWTPDLALEFAISETGQGEDFLRSEIDRYLGWPAQAISYKIGEREWLAARADAQSRLGGEFDLRRFHTLALSLGPVGLAQLRSELSTAI